MLKKIFKRLFGVTKKPPYVVKWRQKETIDGTYWERVHYPYSQSNPEWSHDTTSYVYFLYRGV